MRTLYCNNWFHAASQMVIFLLNWNAYYTFQKFHHVSPIRPHQQNVLNQMTQVVNSTWRDGYKLFLLFIPLPERRHRFTGNLVEDDPFYWLLERGDTICLFIFSKNMLAVGPCSTWRAGFILLLWPYSYFNWLNFMHTMMWFKFKESMYVTNIRMIRSDFQSHSVKLTEYTFVFFSCTCASNG